MKKIKKESQARSLDKTLGWRTGISHKFDLISEFAETDNLKNSKYNKYINFSINVK